MKQKIVTILLLMVFLTTTGCASKQRNDGIIREEWSHTYEGYPVVYISPEVSSEGLLSAYELLEVSDSSNVAIKLSDTEDDSGFVWSDFIGELSQALGGDIIVENVGDTNFTDYDYTIVLSHFRSHRTVGFNGAVKQAAIISASSINPGSLMESQSKLEALAEAGKHTEDDLDGHILYISVMDRLTIESGGEKLPESNTYQIGVLASYDPVALDQACIDMVQMVKEGAPLAAHIEALDGIDTLIHAERIGLGSRTYALTVADT